MTKNQQAQLSWRDDRLPVSTRFDDPYFSLADGLAETRHVFLAGNDLGARLCDGFHIGELGFGTGLNFLATLALWREHARPGRFRFTSFEAYPMAGADIRKALAAFPDVAPLGDDFLPAWDKGARRIEGADFTLEVIEGDARTTLPAWQGQVDAWFLDGFSPAKNPELWGADLMDAVAARLAPGGSLATYTAAGHVRRALGNGGLEVQRTPGFARKRHMTVARKPEAG